jgi:hypothetical protein
LIITRKIETLEAQRRRVIERIHSLDGAQP